MIELGVSQAQSQFTKLLDKTTLIVDKKSNQKKAVLLPYEIYLKLLFDRFVGSLDENFITNDKNFFKEEQIVLLSKEFYNSL